MRLRGSHMAVTNRINVCPTCGTEFFRPRYPDQVFCSIKCRRPADPLPRLLKYVDKSAASGCWMWTGCLNHDGYGRFMLNGRCIVAHRASWQLHIGTIPAGVQLDHKCHDPLKCLLGTRCPHRRCVNPIHLELTDLVD